MIGIIFNIFGKMFTNKYFLYIILIIVILLSLKGWWYYQHELPVKKLNAEISRLVELNKGKNKDIKVLRVKVKVLENDVENLKFEKEFQELAEKLGVYNENWDNNPNSVIFSSVSKPTGN